MTLILDRLFPRTLDALLARFCRDAERGTALQAWTFDDAPARRAAEARLAGFGVAARLRSAYKPLLHALLEEVDRDGLASVRVRYPVHPAAAPNRFRLETYPLAALVEYCLAARGAQGVADGASEHDKAIGRRQIGLRLRKPILQRADHERRQRERRGERRRAVRPGRRLVAPAA